MSIGRFIEPSTEPGLQIDLNAPIVFSQAGLFILLFCGTGVLTNHEWTRINTNIDCLEFVSIGVQSWFPLSESPGQLHNLQKMCGNSKNFIHWVKATGARQALPK